METDQAALLPTSFLSLLLPFPGPAYSVPAWHSFAKPQIQTWGDFYCFINYSFRKKSLHVPMCPVPVFSPLQNLSPF